MDSGLWPQPRRRNVGTFSDLSLYVDALELARQWDGITPSLLKEELKPRLYALRLIQEQSTSAVRSLVSELQLFGWLESAGPRARPGTAPGARLTLEGQAILEQARTDRRAFLRALAERMQAVYVVPGWFVNRLWTINPSQGEVILPAPGAEWSPSQTTRDARAWTPELSEQTLRTSAQTRATNPLAFPVEDATWCDAVRRSWERLRDRKTRREVREVDPITSSRSGLTLAMRMASLSLLFGCTLVGHSQPDFPCEPPITVKSFKLWCPRLQALELLGYTDWHPQVAGRLLFPTAVFRTPGPSERFERLSGIRHPDGRVLCLHQPAWEGERVRFWQTLVSVYEEGFRRVQSRYISLLDVRDEISRRLRLSPARFESFLERAYHEGVQEGGWHLSLETDSRADLRTGRGLARRPVCIDAVPHTLIALARLSPACPGVLPDA